jgi:hypothetical protein
MAARRTKWSLKFEEGKKKKFLEELDDNHGIATPVLKRLQIPWKKYKEWCEDDEFLFQVNQSQEKSIQYVENILFELIEERDKTAVIFFLKTRCKEKYSETTRFEVSQQKELEINILPPTMERLEGPDSEGNIKIKKNKYEY